MSSSSSEVHVNLLPYGYKPPTYMHTTLPVRKPSTDFHAASTQYSAADLRASSAVETHRDMIKQEFNYDPSSWCVDEVIQFMRHKDPEMSGSLHDLLRHHEIDGKALLLLKSDVIMKYMGLKLGPTLKLCHYIDELREGK